MFQIQQVTNSPLQKMNVVLSDNSVFAITLYFRPMQYGWFIQEIIYKNFKVNEMRIVNSPNIFHQFRNQIPFGLGCSTTSNREPSQQSDFSSGASKLYVLTTAEVNQYTEYLSGQS